MSNAQAFPTAEKSDRLVSLDLFRGLTIAAMVMVNNPGDWGHMFRVVEHAPWDGWTPTDFIFPFFLFIVGVAMTFSFDKRLHAGASRTLMLEQVVRRTIILFMLGLIGYGFPNMRVILPYIIFIVGLEFFYKDEPILSFSGGQKARRNKLIGIVGMLAGVIFFVVDFAHFQSPVTAIFDWKHAFPTTNVITNDKGDQIGSVLRLPGVLQRIALCYFFCSLIMFFFRLRGRIAWTVALTLGYYLIVRFIHAPAGYVIGNGVPGAEIGAPADAPFIGTLNDWFDVKLLGSHLYGERPDPEGLLSTLPAMATTLLGALTGTLLLSKLTREHKALWMMLGGAGFLMLGLIVNEFFPINKKLWSSAFVFFMTGWALWILSICYALADVFMYRKWATPFLIFGTNAIFVFVGSGIIGRMMLATKLNVQTAADPKWMGLKTYIYNNAIKAHIHHPEWASWTYSFLYILLWLALTYPLYRKKIFLKI
ncbi:DUF5009 domain-containing protein [Candidatus Sumerlaeota bacterium]|nr:DUF5009 domain-containing protein [Candidatus Sumerlaeota bacterium]